MKLFARDTETELYPRQDPDVIRCQAAVDAAHGPKERAQAALRAYKAAHWEEPERIPHSPELKALEDDVTRTNQVFTTASAARDEAFAAAVARARTARNDDIGQELLDGAPIVGAFADWLAKCERRKTEADAAEVRDVFDVSQAFLGLTSVDVADKYERAKRALGLI